MFTHILFVEEDDNGKLTIISNYTILENFLGLILISGFNKLSVFTLIDFIYFIISSILCVFIYLTIDEHIKMKQIKNNILTTIKSLETIQSELDSIIKLNKNKYLSN